MPTTEELLTELEQPEYAGLTTAEKVSALNEQNITHWRKVDRLRVLDQLIALDIWPRIEGILIAPLGGAVDQPLDANGTTLRLLAATTRTYYTAGQGAGETGSVDAQDPKLQEVIGAYQATGTFSAEQVNAFYGIFQYQVSRAEELWGDGTTITEAQVRAAELQPSREELQAIELLKADGWNRVSNFLGTLYLALDNGDAITVPTWGELVNLFEAEP